MKLLERLVDAALKNGANQIHGLEYRTSELRKHRDHARKMAIAAAREKAEALAAELGCKVGPPRTISEGGFGYVANSLNWMGNGFAMQNAMHAAPGGGDAVGEQTMPLGQIGIRGGVSVTFDLVPPKAEAAQAQ